MQSLREKPAAAPAVKLFLCGDVMTGRGIDQILRHPGDPALHEPCVENAADYVRLAERANDSIPRSVGGSYLWGAALDELRRFSPDLRVINLETAITTSSAYDPAKQVHYRMHPANIECLTAAGIQCCALANNHVLDWGRPGLLETLATLASAGIASVGAGRNLEEASRPAVFELTGKRRVLVFSCGCQSAGIPSHWAATDTRAGIWLVDGDRAGSAHDIADRILQTRRPTDVVVLSIHWGGNWGYAIPAAHRAFARTLIDRAGIDVVHGHSSHHVKGHETFRGRLILYGCGDLLTDYEGIAGHEEFRDDLGLLYFVTIDSRSRELAGLEMVPTQLKRFRLTRPSAIDSAWLVEAVSRDTSPSGTSITLSPDNRLQLRRDEIQTG